jgi:hypothetical protein
MERRADGRTDERGAGKTMGRRGILAAAGAAVAGIAAKQASGSVAATSGGGDQGFLALGSNPWYIAGFPINTNNQAAVAASPTVIQASPNYANYAGSNGAHRTVFEVDARPSAGDLTGIVAFGAGAYPGVVGNGTAGGIGVQGFVAGSNLGLPSRGVYGEASQYGYGVHGKATGSTSSIGVFGETDLGIAVLGQTFNHASTGVRGESLGGAPGDGNGVYGFVEHVGTTRVTAGIFGDSTASYGIIGRTTAVNYSGCTGIADGAGRAAFAGAGTNGAYGAYFTGPTVINGDFTVVGGHRKNAAVKHMDGSYRLLHCVEAPEPWFEDFGEAKLVNGKAEVKLDPDFAAVVDTAGYQVFLTEYGARSHLTVMARTPSGFSVEAEKAGASGAFGWRLVAKRKDITVERLAKFELPKIRLPKLEEMPPPPAPPKATPSPLPSTKP